MNAVSQSINQIVVVGVLVDGDEVGDPALRLIAGEIGKSVMMVSWGDAG